MRLRLNAISKLGIRFQAISEYFLAKSLIAKLAQLKVVVNYKYIIPDLVGNGFSNYEARAYCTLLDNGPLQASEISLLADIPQGRVYNVLGTLEKKGFCSMFLGSVKRYRAVNPGIAFGTMLQEQLDAYKRLETISEELEKSFQEKETTPVDFIQVLTSKQSQIERFDDLIKVTETSLYSFNKRPYATGFMRELAEIDRASEPLKRILKKGVKVKALFESESGEHMGLFVRMLEYYESIGESIRIVEKLPLKMLLSDKSTAMVSMRNQSSDSFADRFNLTSMVVEHSDLTGALVELFENYWNRSMTLDQYKAQKISGIQSSSES
jgi:sugar-specific transcriptional regulator TrmB